MFRNRQFFIGTIASLLLASGLTRADTLVFPPESVETFIREAAMSGRVSPTLRDVGHLEAEQADGSWCPSKVGYYVAWANNLTTYWFGPFAKAEDTMSALASLSGLKTRLEQIYPNGVYREAHFLPFALVDRTCVQPSIYLQAGMGNQRLIEKAYFDWTETKAQEWSTKLKALQSCLSQGENPSICSEREGLDPGEALREIREIRRGVFGDPKAGSPKSLGGTNRDPSGGSGGASGGAGEKGGPTGSDASKSGKGGSEGEAKGSSSGSEGGGEDGGGFLPGSAPKWLQNAARIAAKAFGLEGAEYLVIALYMLAPDLVADIAKVVGDATKDLLPKDVADALGTISDVVRMAQQVSESIEAIKRDPQVLNILREMDKNPLTHPALEEISKKTGIDIKTLENIDTLRKALSNEIPIEERLRDLKAKATKEGERWVRVAVSKELEKAGLTDITRATEALLAGNGKKVARQILEAAVGREAANTLIDKTVLDAFERGDLVQMSQHLRDTALQAHVRLQMPWLQNLDQARQVAAALRIGDVKAAWTSGLQGQLDQLPQGDRRVIETLLAGRPQEAKKQALQEALKKSGIRASTARVLSDTGDVSGAVNTEVYQLTGVTSADWRLFAIRGMNQGEINLVREKLRDVPTFQDLADVFGQDQQKLRVDIQRVFTKTEQLLLASLRSSGNLNVNDLTGFRNARGQLEEKALETIVMAVKPSPILLPTDLLRLSKERDAVVARQALERVLGGDDLLKASLERNERKQQESVQHEFERLIGSLKNHSGKPLFDAEQQVHIQRAEAGEVAEAFAQKALDIVGLRTEVARHLALQGELSASVAVEVEQRNRTGDSDLRAATRHLKRELTDLQGLRQRLKARADQVTP